MRNRIAVRLIMYFAVFLLLFAVVVGSVFIWSFGEYSAQLHRQDIRDRATRIADTMAGYLGQEVNQGQNSVDHENGGVSGSGSGTGSGNGSGGGKGKNSQNGMAGYGRYLSLLDDIAMSDVWLVDSERNLITRGENHEPVTEKQLPEDADGIITEILGGGTSFSESFSTMLDESSLTVGVPIMDTDRTVLGAVLLHSPIHGLREARNKQIQVILVGIFVALLVTIPLAILLSVRFAGPLKKMRAVSAKLASGDYNAKTEIRRKDEIGQLAGSIDVLSDRLAAVNRERQDMEKARQTFFSSISHELRTPVTVMRASLEALTDGIVHQQDKVKEYHMQLLNESIHLQRLVNDLLEISRLQNSDFTLEMSKLNLADIVYDTMRAMLNVSEKKEVGIQIKNLSESMPFYGDYSRLRQMLVITVDNAVKFSPRGGSVVLEGFEQDGGYMLSVADHGPGISQEELPHIFDRFHREHSQKNNGGTGLGLTIAKEIALRHSIEIKVESKPGDTQFRFYFPIDHQDIF